MEQKALEKAAKIDGHGNALAVLMAMHTGMRIGEICALKWRDIRFDQQLLTVEATYQRLPLAGTHQTVLNYGSTKSSAARRVIPL
ncbi:tyrosine-type recombinase/integrase, partial [Enterococcus gilvus]